MENAKQQAIERIQAANNVLVTVSNNPSVDQLASAIGLTLFLNKLNKHATTVFSGQVPSTIEFLQPEKTIEKTTDSLRDFIIALDKSKADKLRYKVEDKLVKIFITPYHTSIGEKDLEFSHGDFNVDVVIALGVQKKEELDQAITAHGRILHDATVITINTGANTTIGAINWQEVGVSSLCELIYGVVETIKADGIDGQIATALLTGIVAETERFSNSKTSSTAMGISSKLMTAGANQQLVATKLQPPAPQPKPAPDESFSVPKGSAEANTAARPKEKKIPAPAQLPKPVKSDGELSIDHDKSADSINQILNGDEEEDDVEQVHIDDQGTLKYATELAREQASTNSSQVVTESGQPPAPVVTQPPIIGNAMNTPVDPLTTDVNPLNQPMLNHDAGPPPSLADQLQATSSADTITDIEESVHSPHVQQEAEELANAPTVNPDLDRARQAVADAAKSSAGPLPPTDALNASHIDLSQQAPDLSAAPAIPSAPEEHNVHQAGLQPDMQQFQPLVPATPPDITEPAAPLPPAAAPVPSPAPFSAPPFPPTPDASIPADMPPGLVPPAIPVDITASPNDASTSAPPVVPPPMMPPMPPSAQPLPPQSNDGPPPPPPAPTSGNPLFPQP